MYLRRILAALPVLAALHVVTGCSDQPDDAFPNIPPNADAADGGGPSATTPAKLTSKKLCSVTKSGDAGKVISGTLLLPDAPMEELADTLDAHREHLQATGALAERRRSHLRKEVIAIATHRMRRALERAIAEDPAVQQLLERVVERELDPADAAATILQRTWG